MYLLGNLSRSFYKSTLYMNKHIKNILSALFILIAGLVLLNLTFLIYAVIINGLGTVLFKDSEYGSYNSYMRVLISFVFISLYLYIHFKTKLRDLFKAALSTIPIAIVFVMIGLMFYHTPILVYAISGLTGVGILFYLKRTKQPWFYYFAFTAVSLSLIIMMAAGRDI